MSKKTFVALILGTFFVSMPFIITPSIYLNRPNDLTQFFWPLIYYTKYSLITWKQIPLWNINMLSGTPLITDPQNPVFYILNIIYLFFSVDTGLLLSLFLHLIIGALGMYQFISKAMKFDDKIGIITSIIYIASPQLFGYIEAGHIGLVQAWSWFPWLVYSVFAYARTRKFKYLLYFSAFASFIFFSHVLTSAIAMLASIFLYLFLIKKDKAASIVMLSISLLIFLGLIAVGLLPQIFWAPETTRSLLLTSKDVYPKWNSIKEFTKIIVFPWVEGSVGIHYIPTEKMISLGLSLSLISFISFINLKKYKYHLFIFGGLILSIVINNLSPIEDVLLNQKWYILLRVSTRFWFLVTFTAITLTAFFLQKIRKQNHIFICLSIILILEQIFISYTYLKRVQTKKDYVSKEVIELIKSSDLHRVYCTTRCISPKDAVMNGLQLVEGYSTLIQKNYYQHSWQLMGGYWNYYTLSLPPMGITNFEKKEPNPQALGEYNTLYIVSPYPISNEKWEFIQIADGYYVYKNLNYKSRIYNSDSTNDDSKIIYYSPNRIIIKTSSNSENLILADTYSQGWKLYSNGKFVSNAQETPSALRSINAKSNSIVELRYEPKGFKLGLALTIFMWIIWIYLRQKGEKIRSLW